MWFLSCFFSLNADHALPRELSLFMIEFKIQCIYEYNMTTKVKNDSENVAKINVIWMSIAFSFIYFGNVFHVIFII